MPMPGFKPDGFFNIWRAWRMRRSNGKVKSPPSLLQDIWSFADLLILVFVTLTARLEAAKKALSEERATWLAVDQSLTEEKAAWQTSDQSLQASEESNAALHRDL
jgi:hypothetical protein